MQVLITSTLPEVAAHMGAVAETVPGIIQAGRQAAAEAVRDVVIPVIVAHTPRQSGKLADSTTADIEQGTDEVIITFRQPAESAPNADGSGGGQHYVRWVVLGRGPITAPSDGPYSTGKLALRLPWGVFKSVKAAPANPYPAEAMQEAKPEIRATALAAGRGINTVIVHALGGRT